MRVVTLLFLLSCFSLLFSGFFPDITVSEGHARTSLSLLLLDSEKRGNEVFAVGERGSFLHSYDNGKSWSREQLPTPVLLTTIQVLRNEWWAAGHDATILHGNVKKKKAEVQYAAPEREQAFFDILFTDPQHGFAVGSYGLFLKTENGGKKWEDISRPEDDRHLYAITRLHNNDLLIAGEAGLLLRSGDNGENWQAVKPPSHYQGSFFGLLQLSSGELFLYGMEGTVFSSDDNGRSWRKIDTFVHEGLQGACPDGKGGAFFAGSSGIILHLYKGNATHSRLRRLGSLSSVIPLSSGSFLLFGEKGVSRPLSFSDLTATDTISP